MVEPLMIKKKVCLLGSFNVGKTSLVRRFVYNVFEDFYLSTIGVKVSQKTMAPLKTKDGREVQYQLMIWDIEGQEKWNAVTRNYFLGSAGAVLVVDLTRQNSWYVISSLMQQFKEINPQAVFVLAANKLDLLPKQHVRLQEVEAFASEIGVHHWLTSAKTGYNVEHLFHALVEQF